MSPTAPNKTLNRSTERRGALCRFRSSLGTPLRMTYSKAEQWIRLGLGAGVNVELWQLFQALTRWSSVERDLLLALVSGALGAAGTVCLLPLLWRGQACQAPVVFVLLCLPVFALLGSIWLIIGYL